MTALICPLQIDDFNGLWSLERHINHADGTRATFSGQAEWTKAAGGYAYKETGEMRIGDGAPLTAERRYFWKNDLGVYFNDGRFFHDVPPQGGDTYHWCDPDTYNGTYDFTAWPEFSVSWRVKGPKKQYVMHSKYKFIGLEGLR